MEGLEEEGVRPVELAVMFPLEDVRGNFVDHLRTWADQTLARDRYRLVVAVSPEDGGAAAVEARAVLAPQDAIVTAPGRGLIDLWNTAAAAARAPWLLLTEGHCRGTPECLSAVVDAITEDQDIDAAGLNVVNQPGTALQTLGSRWIDEEVARRDWLQLKLAGSLIRRSLFEQLGGLDARLGIFSLPMLEAQLRERNARVITLERPTVLHVFETEIADTAEHVSGYARGEFEARDADNGSFCEQNFGLPTVWANRARFSRPLARTVSLAVLKAALASPRDATWLPRELAAWAPAAVAGPRLHRAATAVTCAANQLVAARLPLPTDWRYRAFSKSQNAVVERTRLEWLADHPGRTPPTVLGEGVHGAGDLGPETLVGAHELENLDDRPFRWIHPSAALWVTANGRSAEMCFDTGGIRGRPNDYVCAVYANSHRIGPDNLRMEHGRVVAAIPREATSEGSSVQITILCRPMRNLAGGDARRLGMPLVGVELRTGSD